MDSSCFFFFQAEDGIRDLVRSRGLGDVYKRQPQAGVIATSPATAPEAAPSIEGLPLTMASKKVQELSLIHI